jgi:acyl-coenzyme A synthetase/AMP-(fatty) acid ligase
LYNTAFEALRRRLDRYKKNHSTFQGFVLDFPRDSEENTRRYFYKQVAGMVSSFAIAIRLPSRRVLILLPGKYDCALVAHRLCSNIGAAAMLFFESGNADIVAELIRDC